MFTRREFFDSSSVLFLGGMIHGLFSSVPTEATVSAIKNALEGDRSPNLGGLLVIQVYGGMDATVGLNPWMDARPDPADLFLDPNYEVLPYVRGTDIHLGPSAHALAAHASDLAVVNGIFMATEDIGHFAAQNYMATAEMTGGTPHFIARLAERDGGRRRNKESILFNNDLRTYGVDGVTKIHVSPFIGRRRTTDGAEEIIETFGSFFTDTSPFAQSYEALKRDIEERKVLSQTHGGLDIFSQIRKLRDKVGTLRPEHGAVASFASGYARFAQINWGDISVDTHTNFEANHQRQQKLVWERLSSLISLLKETPFLDTDIPLFPDLVTLVATTEFSRPPFLNRNRGKDHNPLDNSIILAGRGINGGHRIGHHNLFVRDSEKRAQSQLSGGHIDYRTGEPIAPESVDENDKTIDLIRPRNIQATLAATFGLKRELSPHAKILPGVLRT